MINILSYSGGADSTAALIWCKLNNIPIEDIINMEEWFPYPGDIMQKYFKYIEKKFNINIIRLPCNRLEWIRKNGGHHPRLPHPYCCRVKSEIFANYCKEKYGPEGIIIIMGIRRIESAKRNKYIEKGDWYWNNRFSVNYQYWYPIFRFIDAKHYCNINKVKINPLYDNYGRLGCLKCYKAGELRWKPRDEQQKYLIEFMEGSE